ncbi:DUF4276 family protein [Thioclava sp. IC9]|uniref:DUF4276 family protein n=1 Tax=Thioclava sp. IC9 TaxID=1973007 RepID=UPI000B538D0B|nr:DUF4276 family protein [Thioclava sp. IC9]OWY04104.1 hypothetical protein B6V76_06100 [Thioclava sp. IC9]
MHFEFLVEDQSGKVALEGFLPNLLPPEVTYKIHSYKGIGHIPKNLKGKLDPAKRILLNRLPSLLAGYGKAFSKYPDEYDAAVILVCDLDDRNKRDFVAELNAILDACDPRPDTRFCLCVEEGEAWLLGHREAVETAYPLAKSSVLNGYENDSICGTWELLADAVFPGGASALIEKGKPEVGRMKSVWASEIAPLIDVDHNQSPSFQFFVRTLRELLNFQVEAEG